jgi:hypothetical protein
MKAITELLRMNAHVFFLRSAFVFSALLVSCSDGSSDKKETEREIDQADTADGRSSHGSEIDLVSKKEAPTSTSERPLLGSGSEEVDDEKSVLKEEKRKEADKARNLFESSVQDFYLTYGYQFKYWSDYGLERGGDTIYKGTLVLRKSEVLEKQQVEKPFITKAEVLTQLIVVNQNAENSRNAVRNAEMDLDTGTELEMDLLSQLQDSLQNSIKSHSDESEFCEWYADFVKVDKLLRQSGLTVKSEYREAPSRAIYTYSENSETAVSSKVVMTDKLARDLANGNAPEELYEAIEIFSSSVIKTKDYSELFHQTVHIQAYREFLTKMSATKKKNVQIQAAI